MYKMRLIYLVTCSAVLGRAQLVPAWFRASTGHGSPWCQELTQVAEDKQAPQHLFVPPCIKGNKAPCLPPTSPRGKQPQCTSFPSASHGMAES